MPHPFLPLADSLPLPDRTQYLEIIKQIDGLTERPKQSSLTHNMIFIFTHILISGNVKGTSGVSSVGGKVVGEAV